MQERIMTLHPDTGKVGVNIEVNKYNQMKDTLLGILKKEGEMSFGDLAKAAKNHLKGKFDGSIGWYMTTVKLDLEARKLVKCNRKSSPQKIALV